MTQSELGAAEGVFQPPEDTSVEHAVQPQEDGDTVEYVTAEEIIRRNLISVKRAAEIVGVTPSAINQFIKSHKIPAWRQDYNTVLVHEEDVMKLKNRRLHRLERYRGPRPYRRKNQEASPEPGGSPAQE